VVIRTHTERTPIIVNCQLGKRRSTITANWVQSHSKTPRTPQTGFEKFKFSTSMSSISDRTRELATQQRTSYQVINRGLDVKKAVDDAITLCAQTFDLHKAIEEAKLAADEAVDERQKRREAQKGLQHLQQYFELIVFQAYLHSTPADTWRDIETFENFVNDRPADGANALKPLERVDVSDGVAMPDEVVRVVANRSGVVLSASTILKSDFFSNLQKMSLP
ncbi:13592_t:CDS:2, partial [Acaulospora colombiana]